MGLTPWRVIGLAVAAMALVVVAFLDIAAPAKTASCGAAKSSLTAGMTSQAERAYVKILGADPTSDCAQEGMAKLGEKRCERASQLSDAGATLEAVKLYTAALNEQPWGQRPPRCALEGLRKASSAVAVADCHEVLKAACNVTVVNVNGVNGRNGFNGKNGNNGADGKPGEDGHNGQNGKPGAPGRNGSNGRNGMNGGSGRNGLNGHNGHNGLNGRNGLNGTTPSTCGYTGCS